MPVKSIAEQKEQEKTPSDKVSVILVQSNPPEGSQYKKVDNVYIELINNQPKVKVEYEE